MLSTLIFLSFCCSINLNQRRWIPLLQGKIGTQSRPSGKKVDSIWPCQWLIVKPLYNVYRNFWVEARRYNSIYLLFSSFFSIFFIPVPQVYALSWGNQLTISDILFIFVLHLLLTFLQRICFPAINPRCWLIHFVGNWQMHRIHWCSWCGCVRYWCDLSCICTPWYQVCVSYTSWVNVVLQIFCNWCTTSIV